MSRDRLRSWSPVVMAGLSFLGFAAIVIPLGHLLGSSILAGLGGELAFDGAFYFVGGSLSAGFKRSHRHWLSCTAKELLELVALLTGTVGFALGAWLQPSTQTGRQQIIVSFAFGIAAVLLYRYWHEQTEASEDAHHGFSWHLVADMIAAASLGPVALLAYLTHEPAWNFYGAVGVVGLVILLAIRPTYQITQRMYHHRSYHSPTG